MASVEVMLEVERIRELIKTHGVCKTARMTGRAKSTISRIKNGTRHSLTVKKDLTVDSLKLRKLPELKLCRRCGDGRRIFSQTGVCIECELIDLARRGLLSFEEAQVDER